MSYHEVRVATVSTLLDRLSRPVKPKQVEDAQRHRRVQMQHLRT